MSNILIAGGTGLVGTRLSQILTKKGHQVRHLSRKERPNAAYPTYTWNARQQTMDKRALEGVDYVINLAGAGIADQRWTAARKKVLIDSRVATTELLAKQIQQFGESVKGYFSAAAIGIYGDRGDEVLTESASIGKKGFLVECCVVWEQAIEQAAATTGVRTAAIRVGLVLSTNGGALPKMMLPLKFFSASYFGDGSQWYSWVHIDDVCRMFLFLIENEMATGFYNGTAPNPLTNKALTHQMVEALDKNAIVIPAPAFGLRLGMGEMADVVLNSNRVLPEKLQLAGFQFAFPEFKKAIQDVVAREV